MFSTGNLYKCFHSLFSFSVWHFKAVFQVGPAQCQFFKCSRWSTFSADENSQPCQQRLSSIFRVGLFGRDKQENPQSTSRNRSGVQFLNLTPLHEILLHKCTTHTELKIFVRLFCFSHGSVICSLAHRCL